MLMMIVNSVFCFRKRKAVNSFTNYADSNTVIREGKKIKRETI